MKCFYAYTNTISVLATYQPSLEYRAIEIRIPAFRIVNADAGSIASRISTKQALHERVVSTSTNTLPAESASSPANPDILIALGAGLVVGLPVAVAIIGGCWGAIWRSKQKQSTSEKGQQQNAPNDPQALGDGTSIPSYSPRQSPTYLIVKSCHQAASCQTMVHIRSVSILSRPAERCQNSCQSHLHGSHSATVDCRLQPLMVDCSHCIIATVWLLNQHS